MVLSRQQFQCIPACNALHAILSRYSVEGMVVEGRRRRMQRAVGAFRVWRLFAAWVLLSGTGEWPHG